MKDSVDLLIDPIKGFHSNIERDVIENTNFRKVLYTSMHLQVVLMSLKPGEEIGEEIHNANDQFFRFESGNGKCNPWYSKVNLAVLLSIADHCNLSPGNY